jgi:hypothetical protein
MAVLVVQSMRAVLEIRILRYVKAAAEDVKRRLHLGQTKIAGRKIGTPPIQHNSLDDLPKVALLELGCTL